MILFASCTQELNCPLDKLEKYLHKSFDIIEDVGLAAYQSEKSPEYAVIILSDRSEFNKFSEVPDCAIKHHEIIIELIDLLAEQASSNEENSIDIKINEKYSELDIATAELVNLFIDQDIKDDLINKYGDAKTIKERAEKFFSQNAQDELSETQKEEIILDFINNLVEKDPQMTLSHYIKNVTLDIANEEVIFYVWQEIESEEDYEEIFNTLFFAALANSVDSNENFIWNVNSIGVVFIDNDNNRIDLFLEGDDFQEFFKNPENLFNIIRINTSD